MAELIATGFIAICLLALGCGVLVGGYLVVATLMLTSEAVKVGREMRK